MGRSDIDEYELFQNKIGAAWGMLGFISKDCQQVLGRFLCSTAFRDCQETVINGETIVLPQPICRESCLAFEEACSYDLFQTKEGQSIAAMGYVVESCK
jgi:hypothetical protein